MIRTLGINQFDQCVLNMSLINLCNQTSYVGQSIRRLHNLSDDDALGDPWRKLHQLTVHIPHPEQLYDGMTLEAGLTQGYNIEVKTIADPSQIPYKISEGGQFVVVMRQKGLDAGFEIAATGLFIRPLALLRLDVIMDMTTPEYQSIVVKHPIIRDYPSGWEDKLNQFLNQTISYHTLPNLVGYVDQTLNPDYRPPSWNQVHLAAKSFAGV
ncbi:hypothetical protein DO97_10260 [Neosynechococcus sphagnicola sy1]|uniref:Uncharacterized protein n=1 Tax=Neosynechococcus sphagnicola sy1 TaxID=1497020 RepID=A0A098TNF0_9CYAN|nr:hypothetical protein [Neosynechococcus sphagnicola]KGF73786.1 hypothetical protein DO97_10260 [Neosynechococcus sphagnicola sy1]